jgi:hypothetical protein
MTRQQDEIKAVLNLIDAIFYGDAGHRLGTPSVELVVNCQLGILWRTEFQAFLSWFSRNHLLRDPLRDRSKPIAGILSVLRDGAAAPQLIGDAALLC